MAVSHSAIWLIVGIVFCVMEFVLPTAFLEVALGLSAFIVAAAALVIPSFGVQVALWMLLSLILTLLVRRLMPKRTPRAIAESSEAETLTEILPGQTGRVIYEGGSWQARSELDVAIAPNQRVYVVERRGTTLIVVPEHYLDSLDR
ncbi:MAG: NfeD family protein [Kaiparowitsia implicata GSE-PSE-MK54-09C]|jgi:membrane protein implicated in regulation of membrane protease activity|nr:NfeD family protein [Kaiparowitsia implicata GSE-PSE-MK54-09C]